MLSRKHILMFAGFVSLLALCLAGYGNAGTLQGSAHDFSSTGSSAGWNTNNDLCRVCHTPHNAQTVADAPLWNRQQTTASYTIYSGPGSLDATDLTQPAGVSKLCLGCHDGTVALENYGGNTGGTNYATGGALLDTDLSNDHPISFTFDSALVTADGELKLPGASLPLFNNKLECATCHDVHNTDTVTTKLLRVDPASGNLCLQCHVK